MNAVGALATLAWFFVGCGARVSGAGSGARGTSDAGAGAADRVGVGDGGAPGIGPSDARPMDSQALPPPDFTRRPTVWVGQSDRTVTFPDGYDGGTVVPDPLQITDTPTGPEKVVLILDAETNPVTGTITFGDLGPPPAATDPNQPYPAALPTAFEIPDGRMYELGPSIWYESPLAGFSYSLVASTLSGNLLQLAFVPSQLWQGWCAIQDSSTQDASASSVAWFRPCLCDAGACTSPNSPTRELTLTVTGDTMQGQLLLQGLGYPSGPPQIRLQRVQ